MKRLVLVAAAVAAAFGLGNAFAAEERTQLAPEPPAGMAVATFAAGCFWCVEPPFDKTEGVVSTTSGYTGGTVAGATYRRVRAGGPGPNEGVRAVSDPAKGSYAKLLDAFWQNGEPLDGAAQF